MRVLNVNHTLDSVHGGGTAERTFQISRFLARAGVDCTVLTTAAGMDPRRTAELAGVTVVAVPLLFRRFFVPRPALAEFHRLVSHADVVHLMGHWTLLNAVIYWFSRRLRKPYVVCPAGALPIFGRSRLLKQLYNRVVGRSIVQNASACVAITEDEIAHFAQYGVTADRIRVIPNGINAEDFSKSDPEGFRARFGLGSHPLVLFVGRLNPIKGPDLLLQAFLMVKNRFPDHHLVFAGPDGGMLGTLRQTTRAAGMDDRVHFIGYLGGMDKASAYRAATLLAIPSRQEAMSIVALEAGINGVPVLLTDRCGFNAVEGRGGKVVGATAEDIATGLGELLAAPAKLKEMGKSLNEFTRERHLWGTVVRGYITLYDQLTSRGSG